MPWRLLEAVDDNNGGKVNLKPSPALREILNPILAAAGDGALSVYVDRNHMQEAIDPGLNDMFVSALYNPKTWLGSFTKEDYDNGTNKYYWIHSGFWKRFKDIPAQFFEPWQSDSYYFGMGNPNDASGSYERPYCMYRDEFEISGHHGVMNPSFCEDLTGCVCNTNGYSYLDVPPGPGAIGGPWYIQHDDGSPTYVPYKQVDGAAWHEFLIAVNETTDDFAYICVDHATATNANVDENNGYRLFVQTVTLYHKAYDYKYFLDIETEPDPDPVPPSPTPDPENPYENDELNSDDQHGGRAVGDTESDFGPDDITLPTISMQDVGFCRAYKIEEEDLDRIAKRLWTKKFLDTIEYFIRGSDGPQVVFVDLFMLPVEGDYTNPTSPWCWYSATPVDVRAGGVVFPGGEGNPVIKRWATFKFGKVRLHPRTDGYPDYKKYKKITVTLPFVGNYELDPNIIMSKYQNVTLSNGVKRVEIIEPTAGDEVVLELIYNVDIYTGTCVAIIKVNGHIKYQFPGTMKVDIPWTQEVNIGQTSALKGMLGGLAGTIIGAATGGVGGAVMATAGAATIGIEGLKYNMGGSPSAKVNGSYSSLPAAMQSPYPWVTVLYANTIEAHNQDQYLGRSAPYGTTIGEFDGFVKIKEAHLDGIVATDAEKKEIMSLLKEGVIA